MKRISNVQWFCLVFIWIPILSLAITGVVDIMTDDFVLLFVAAFLVYLFVYFATVAITRAAGRQVRKVKYNLLFIIIRALVYATSLFGLTVKLITQGSPLWVVQDHFWIIDYLVLEVYVIVDLVAWAIMALFSWQMTRKK